MQVVNKYSLVALLFLVIDAHALPFNVVPNGPLPTAVTTGATVSANYVVTNATKRYLAGNLVKWLPPNVTINNTATTCAPTAENFNLNSGQSCLLSLTVSGPVSRSDPNPHHHLFVCAHDKASCAGPIPKDSLNVLTNSNSFAYVANDGNDSISVCPLANDRISSCTFMYDNSFDSPAGIAINPDGTFLYVSNNEGYVNPYSVSICPVTMNGSAIAGCSVSVDATFETPEGLIVNRAGTILYVANASDSTVSLCPINADGTLAACTALSDATFTNTVAITLNYANTRAYVVDSATDQVSLCPIAGNGSFSACTALADASFMIPEGIAINVAGTFAYITNNNNTVSLCPIRADGTFAPCGVLTGNFSSPEGIALNIDSSYAYITNIGNSTVSECPINSDGTFGTCIESSNNLAAPVGITLH